MSQQTLGNSANGNSAQFWFQDVSSGVDIRSNDTLTIPAGGAYLNSIRIFGAADPSGSATGVGAVYNSSTNALLGTFGSVTLSTTVQYWASQLSAGSYLFVAGNTVIKGAMIETGGSGLRTWGRNDGGSWIFNTAVSSLPSTFSSGTSQTGLGNWPWFVTYFAPATVTSIPATAYVGQTITVNGTEFTAGVTSVTINGTAATSVSVTNDTTLTCVVASGTTSGTVTVHTNAGNANSSGTLTIVGGRIERSGSLVQAVNVRLVHGGVLVPATAIRVQNGGTLKNAH